MPDTTDPAASALDGMRERSEIASKIMVSWKAQIQRARASANDVPRLLAALKDALKLADDWDNEAVRLDAVIERSISGGERATRAKAAAQAHKGCADALREAATAALAGKEAGDDEPA